ncbi:ribosome-binding factor A [Chitinivorax tropicus]|uniref:Ribosome-binding factor A n=1 Tax=Chitinivorax tropicus TaxID=714531 RepID=A0A840MN05_9PROT|nr:30S ribosome-binding factor RbfA [Chitinivorax tropicus]MBB5017573.1 ribosome-binding factor A [Chitinivorax tropicus]
MARDFSRSDRVGQQIQRELPNIIRFELKDPRIGMLTITDVEVTRDYSHAKVFFTVLGDETQQAQTLETLEHAAGFLRNELGKRIKMRSMPLLHFKYDVSVERGMQLSSLIDRAVSDTAKDDDEA